MEENEVNDAPEVETPAVEVETPEPKPEGWEKVNFKTDDPDKIEKRFKRTYGQMKEFQEQTQSLKAQNQELMERIARLENTTVESKVDQEIAHLQNARKEARLAGDDDAVDRINDQIADLKAEKKLAKTAPKPRATETSDTSYVADVAYINDWASELTDDGRFVRPWAQKGHPQFKAAFEALANMRDDPQYARFDIEDKLTILERQMKAGKAGQAVLGKGNGMPPRGTPKVTLTPQEMRIAERMFSGPKYKTNEDKYAKYAEAKKRNA